MAKPLYQKVLDFAVQEWLKHQASVDTRTIAREIDANADSVMKAAERLEVDGLVSLNRHAQLNEMSIPIGGGPFTFTPVVCHIVFVKKDVLTEAFHKAGLARENYPIYKERIVKGSQPYSFLYFNEAVLQRYLRDPANYRVKDTYSSVEVEYIGEDSERYFDITCGRRRLEDGSRCVVPLLVDLKKLDADEQRYWHGYEISIPKLMKNDDGFAEYIHVIFEGAWHEFDDPLTDFKEAVAGMNDRLGFELLARTANKLIHVPAENTERAYTEACSELFKLIGSDSLQVSKIKPFMTETFGSVAQDFIHKESKRPKSAKQLIEDMENLAGIEHKLTMAIKELGSERQKAAHLVDLKGETGEIYVDSFFHQCRNVTGAISYFCDGIAEYKGWPRNRSGHQIRPENE